MANILAMKNLIDLANRMKAGKNINIKDLGCAVKNKISESEAMFTIGTDYPGTAGLVIGLNPKKPTTLYGMYLCNMDDFGPRNAVIEFADGTSQAEAGELLTEIMEDRRYVRLTKNKFKSTAKGAKGKVLAFSPAVLKNSIAISTTIGETDSAYIKAGFTPFEEVETKGGFKGLTCKDPNTGIELFLIEVATTVDNIKDLVEDMVTYPLENLGENHPYFTDENFPNITIRWEETPDCIYCFSGDIKQLGIPENIIIAQEFNKYPINGNVVKLTGPAIQQFKDTIRKGSPDFNP